MTGLNDRILGEVRGGRRVLVVAASTPVAQALFYGFVDATPREEVASIRCSAAEERVVHTSGGSVRFGTGGRMWRGLSVDTVMADESTSKPALDELRVCLMAADDPKMVTL